MFTDISPAQSFVTTRNSDVIGTTAEFTAFVSDFRETALDEMQMDIEMILRLEHDDTDSLDTIQGNFGDFLNKALAYKMLEHYYLRYDDGDGRNNTRYKLYQAEYNKLKLQFGQMEGRDRVTTASTVPIARG